MHASQISECELKLRLFMNRSGWRGVQTSLVALLPLAFWNCTYQNSRNWHFISASTGERSISDSSLFKRQNIFINMRFYIKCFWLACHSINHEQYGECNVAGTYVALTNEVEKQWEILSERLSASKYFMCLQRGWINQGDKFRMIEFLPRGCRVQCISH